MSHPDYEKIGSRKSKTIEEIGEVLQAIGKVERFGLFNFHPGRPKSNNFDVMPEAEVNSFIKAGVFIQERYST
jgi:NTP pyrophosphatase (non-canonical NTP hydrolase)